MPLSPPQLAVASSTSRMRVMVAGRRCGKSHLALRELCRFASQPGRRVYYTAPTYRQAKSVLWNMLKERLFGLRWQEKVNESDLSILLKNGSTIALRGTDNFDSLRGVGLHFLVMDEFADCNPDAWNLVLRPTLSDTKGSALFLGTPRGHDHLHAAWLKGQDPDEPDWSSWQFTTEDGGIVDREEIEAARRELSQEVFDQEYRASFVVWEGRAYHAFSRATHCSTLTYDPRSPLIIALDFNREPGVAAICQEQILPNGNPGTAVIGEVWIPRNSITPAVCRKIAQDWGHHTGQVHLYGDASGGAQGSARVAGSDWDLVKAELGPVFGSQLYMMVPAANPAVRARLNAANSRLQSADGTIRLMVDPVKAPHVVADFEGVRLLSGGAGEIDKRADPMKSHISDAISYYIAKKFPIVTHAVGMARWTI
jgi:hypothetical protein